MKQTKPVVRTKLVQNKRSPILRPLRIPKIISDFPLPFKPKKH
jgi:hypothetical protein